jgi:nucleotide-binding universal stress UspA family protein
MVKRSGDVLPRMKFLVAVDGSAESDRALDHAAEMAAAADAELTVVYSVDPDVYDTGGSEPITDLSDAERRLVVESVEDAEARGEGILAEASERVTEVPVATELLYGNPVETVSDFATSEGYDGVFVGHRGLSDAHERVLGSVAKGIVERSTVPVTVVR